MPSKLGKAFTLGVGAPARNVEAGPPPEEPSSLPPAPQPLHAPQGGHDEHPSGPPHQRPAPSEDGSDGSDDDHEHGEYTGPEPTDWWQAFFINFMGSASPKYKAFVLLSLVVNPFILLVPNGKVVAGWFVLVEFLCMLAASLQAYPLQAGGLLLIEANVMGITNPYTLLHEVQVNLNVLLMLIFMVAAIHFLKNMLLWIFTNLLIRVENKIVLSLTFMLSSAVMSAFLDALTVTAVIISVCTGFLGVYYYVEKHSFLPLLNNKRRNEMSYELVPQANPERLVLTEAKVNEIFLNPEQVDEILCETSLEGPKRARSDSLAHEEEGLKRSNLSPGARRSLDMVRRGSVEVLRRGSAEMKRKSGDKRASLEASRQNSDDTRRSLEFARNRSVERAKARASPADPLSAASPSATPHAHGARRSSGRKETLAPPPEQADPKDVALGDLEAGTTTHVEHRKLPRSNSKTDLEGGERSHLAENALLPDGHFAVPKLKEVLSKRIIQPRLPGEVGDQLHTESDLDVRHLENDVNQFKAFLRSIVMHAAVGTTVGGIFTMVGEPQNLIVAKRMQWDFAGFVYQMLPVSLTVLPSAILVLIFVEKTGRFGYGTEMPEEVRWVLADFAEKEFGRMKRLDKAKLITQMLGALLLIVGLVMHFAEVGFIGLMIVVVLTAFNGVTVEHDIAHAFLESMPFVSLLVVFLGIVGMIHDQHLFSPIIQFVLGLEDKTQLGVLYLVNGVLSAVSDNVFVATVFVEELEKVFVVNGTFIGEDAAAQAATKLQYDRLGTAIIAGTNLPSMFTPNGQAALLFILTSSIAPLVHLSYRKMMVMTLPYVLVCASTGALAVCFWQWDM
eukprot:Tamp_02505.p1 GENE.Tamp_02505~~Tamp_02505.p1  ORF type:complete len:844 (+),score=195.10 Tamp_02505:192-2723(+)